MTFTLYNLLVVLGLFCCEALAIIDNILKHQMYTFHFENGIQTSHVMFVKSVGKSGLVAKQTPSMRKLPFYVTLRSDYLFKRFSVDSEYPTKYDSVDANRSMHFRFCKNAYEQKRTSVDGV